MSCLSWISTNADANSTGYFWSHSSFYQRCFSQKVFGARNITRTIHSPVGIPLAKGVWNVLTSHSMSPSPLHAYCILLLLLNPLMPTHSGTLPPSPSFSFPSLLPLYTTLFHFFHRPKLNLIILNINIKALSPFLHKLGSNSLMKYLCPTCVKGKRLKENKSD